MSEAHTSLPDVFTAVQGVNVLRRVLGTGQEEARLGGREVNSSLGQNLATSSLTQSHGAETASSPKDRSSKWPGPHAQEQE